MDIPNLEHGLNSLFNQGSSISGEEELLRIASKYAVQLSVEETRILMLIEYMGKNAKNPKTREILLWFPTRFLELRANVGSDGFVMRALDSIALWRFMSNNGIETKAQR